MAIEITYGSSYPRTNGLKSYLTLYDNCFTDTGYPATNSGFSTLNNNDVVINGITYSKAYADLQYAGATKKSGNATAFITEAKSTGSIGQIVYSLLQPPTRSIFGDLDVIKLGENLTSNGTSFSLGTTHVTISNLMSVLNRGLNNSGWPLSWNSGSGNPHDLGPNDVHNIIYGLMAGGGGNASTAGLRHYFEQLGVVYKGGSANERFDGFSNNDVFEIGTGTDTIFSFGSNSIVNVSQYSFTGVSSPSDLFNEGYAYLSGGKWTIEDDDGNSVRISLLPGVSFGPSNVSL